MKKEVIIYDEGTILIDDGVNIGMSTCGTNVVDYIKTHNKANQNNV